jgi:hypothetical protein
MLIFIDDSGDPGFKIEKGSTKAFVIALIIFDDGLDAEETALKIKKLRKKLKKSERFEFKFNKCSKKFRIKFLETIKGCKFRIRAIVMLKNRIYGKELQRSKESFYNYSIKIVLKHNRGTIKNARLRLDGRGEREFRKKLTVYLRKQLGSGVIKNLRFRDSKKDVLIQLADMVAGSINRTFSEKKDAKIYFDIIKRKASKTNKGDIWIFGK